MGCYGQDWAGYQSPAPSTDGLSFVFIKATEGLTYVNPRYAAQLAHARLHKLVVGHYHYPHMANDPVAEADRFLAVADERPGELLCLDWEGYDAANKGVARSRQVSYKNAFLARLRAARATYQVGTYANKAYLGFDPKGSYGDFFWIATAGLPAGDPGISRGWLFHQYGSKSVDKDYCVLTAGALRAWAVAKEDDMAGLTKMDMNSAVWKTDSIPAGSTEPNKANKTWVAQTFLVQGFENGVQTLAQARQNGAALTSLGRRLDALKGGAPEIDYAKLAAALIAAVSKAAG